MLNAATQTFLGDRSADLVAGYDANLLGTAGSVAFGLSGLDFYKDLSDIAYGLENWENTPGDYLNLGVNLIALIPVIGAFKNLGKPATDAASNVAKRIDDEVANLRAIGANNRSAPDFHNNISQRQPGGYLRAPKTAKAMPSGAPSSGDLAKKIADGHSYDKHVVKQGEYPGVTSKSQFEQVVQNSIENASAEKYLSKGRYAWWDDSTKTVVIFDPKSADGGTAFRPTTGKAYFDNLK